MQPLNVKPMGNSPPRVDRRSGTDRRKVDKGPADGRERRRGIEPRRPEVIEREASPSEWATLQDIPPPPATTPKPAK